MGPLPFERGRDDCDVDPANPDGKRTDVINAAIEEYEPVVGFMCSEFVDVVLTENDMERLTHAESYVIDGDKPAKTYAELTNTRVSNVIATGDRPAVEPYGLRAQEH